MKNERQTIKIKKNSICDALLAETPGKLTFKINKKLLSKGISVSDSKALQAIHLAYAWLKLIPEPGGAVALAAALKESELIKNKNVLIIISGGNIDKEIFLNSLDTVLPIV